MAEDTSIQAYHQLDSEKTQHYKALILEVLATDPSPLSQKQIHQRIQINNPEIEFRDLNPRFICLERENKIWCTGYAPCPKTKVDCKVYTLAGQGTCKIPAPPLISPRALEAANAKLMKENMALKKELAARRATEGFAT